jgi:hypothetical protein
VGNEVGYVLSSIPQGRDLNVHHVEPKEEIVSKTTGLYFFPEVLVRSRDDADVHSDVLMASYSLELLFLEDA